MIHPEVRAALEARRFFKLICGASYRNLDFIRSLSAIFAAAGAHVIDVGARPELVQAAAEGIRQAQVPVAGLPLIMVSVGINDDVHFMRVEKNPERCESHGFCANACPHEVFVGTEIRLQNCLGCDFCVVACPEKALQLVPRDPLENVQQLLQACLAAGASALEVHTGHGGRSELEQILKLLSPYQTQLQLLAFSMGAHGQSHSEIIALARDIVNAAGTEIILQADGKPISGRKGKKSTLPALELAQDLHRAQLGAYLQVSGGINDLTGEVAAELQIPIHGVGMGSFARKFIGLSPSEAPSATAYQAAIEKARILVQSVSKGVAVPFRH